MSWAEPLKEIIGKQLFGLTDDHLYGPDEIREETIEEWGMSPREILQVVGTDMFRAHICDDFWVKAGLKQIRKYLSQGDTNLVVSDTRFPNEVNAVKELGGTTIQVRKIQKVKKATGDSTSGHRSEVALDQYEFDYVISSFAGELDLLYKRMAGVLEKLGEEQNAFSE